MHKVGAIDRKEITIQVADKQFVIGFVSIYARKRAADFQEAVARLLAIQSIEDEEKRKSELNKLVEADLLAKVEVREEVIKTILESNGYEFDADWWDRNTSYADQNEFIQLCMMKDLIQDKKKQAES